MKKDLELCAQILIDLGLAGVTDFCICAGARNAALFFLLTNAKGVRLYSFFDERSAAFFALGRTKQSGRPVVVVTTSGTAAAELIPASIEAHYSGNPLVFLTADRPRSFRGTGAPQAIEQVGLFATHSIATLDVETLAEWHDSDFKSWRLHQAHFKPLHINVCLQEPEPNAEVPHIDFTQLTPPFRSAKAGAHGSAAGAQTAALVAETPVVGDRNPGPNASAPTIELQNPLVLVGPLKKSERAEVLSFLQSHDLPVYAEAISGLRGELAISDREIFWSDAQMKEAFQTGEFRSLVRIGGVPTSRLWRDMESVLASIPVVSISSSPWSGLSRTRLHSQHFTSLSALKHLDKNLRNESGEGPFTKLQLADFQKHLQCAPASREESLLQGLAKKLQNKFVYLGNSLPIREWDKVSRGPFADVEANRGANGIDGQISTFLGWSEGETTEHSASPNSHTNSTHLAASKEAVDSTNSVESANAEFWCIVGDLTTLYDLQSLWITPQLDQKKRRIVVINNSGGRIFEKMFRHPAFLNEHRLEFSGWAQMFGWAYEKWTSIPGNLASPEQNLVIELSIEPDAPLLRDNRDPSPGEPPNQVPA